MHQWSTSIYKGICCLVEVECPTWQVILPQDGLKHSFLSHGLLALASLEISVVGNSPNHANYVSAGLEYHDSALKSFRPKLANITPDNLQAVLAFSLITMIVSLALPQCTTSHDEPQSMAENVVSQLGLVQSVGNSHEATLGQLSARSNLTHSAIAKTGNLEAGLESAITRLNNSNEARLNPVLAESRASKLQPITFHAACRKAIFYLEELFSRCEHPYEKGYALAC